MEDFELVQIDKVSGRVVAYPEVFNFWVPALVLSQLTGCVVVTIEWGRTKDWCIKTIEKLAKEEDLMCRIMYSDVLSIT